MKRINKHSHNQIANPCSRSGESARESLINGSPQADRTNLSIVVTWRTTEAIVDLDRSHRTLLGATPTH